MKKRFIVIGIGIILLMLSGVFADEINYITGNLEAEGKEVASIIEVDPNNLPSQVNIEDIEFGTNLAIYEIDIVGEKPVFAITASDEMFQEPAYILKDTRQLLHFGFNGEMFAQGFLKTATGVSSEEKGYVMMRSGSITGISTILEISETSSGKIEIIIYKNGEPIGFRNTLNAFSLGMQKDYDLQSKNVVMFKPGDIISVSIKTSENIPLEDIITMVEITI